MKYTPRPEFSPIVLKEPSRIAEIEIANNKLTNVVNKFNGLARIYKEACECAEEYIKPTLDHAIRLTKEEARLYLVLGLEAQMRKLQDDITQLEGELKNIIYQARG